MQRWSDGEIGFFDEAAERKATLGSVRRNRPLSGRADEERTLGVSKRSSCCSSPYGWRADRFAADEGFDDDHRCTTVRADEGGLNGDTRVRQLWFGCVGEDVQQFTCLGEMLAACGIGDEAIVADAMKAAGQNVQQEAAHELVGVEGHGLVAGPAFGAVILPAEGDATLVEREQAAVGDGHAMGVAGQIGEHRCWPGKRTLGIDHPFDFAQRCEPFGESARISERGVLSEELQLAATMSLIEFFEEATTEQPREHPYREEEPGLAGDPT